MNTRIKAITDAAAILFLRQGYAGTQMSHIAKAANISVGSIYNDFIGKKEIMHFVLKCMIDPDFINREFERPITDEMFKDINTEITFLFHQIESDFAMPLQSGVADYSFEQFIGDTFDLLARYAVGCLFIEKNQYDFKYLADQYRDYRKSFYQTMKNYLTAFMVHGIVRPLDSPDMAVTMIIEILTWWAMDRRYIAYETSGISLEMAKENCIDTISHAYKL